MGKTYLLENLKRSTFTFASAIKSKEEVEAVDRQSKELDPQKKKEIITQDDHRRFCKMQKDVVLMLGINEISEDQLFWLQKHPRWEMYFSMRPPYLKWVPGFGPKQKDLASFKDLDSTEALDIVEKMWDKKLMEKYLAAEKRPDIKKAIETQMDKLIPKPKAPGEIGRPYAMAS